MDARPLTLFLRNCSFIANVLRTEFDNFRDLCRYRLIGQQHQVRHPADAVVDTRQP